MHIQKALEALKRKDFAAARDLMAREKIAAFTLQHFLIKGLAELALEDWKAAQETFAAATARFPDHALFWLNRGIAEENLGQIDNSIASQEHCLALNPAQAEAYGNLSNLYRKKHRFAEAEEMARRALAKGAAKSDALNCLGLALGKQGKFAEADAAFRQAQRETPDSPATFINRANLAVDQLHFDEAWKLFAAGRAIKDEAIFRHDEGLARLLSGDYERGFKLFESRLEMPRALRLHPTCPRWNGESLKGKKLLILAEQGFGDVIQFCRYQKFLPDGELIWAVPKNLVRLLSDALRGTVLDEKTALPACDYFVPILSLPLLTSPLPLAGRVREGGVPLDLHPQSANDLAAVAAHNTQTSPLLIAPLPNPPREGEGIYLSAPATPKLPQGKCTLKIGLVWAGSRTHERDSERSLRLEQFAPMLNRVEADFYAPVIGEALDEIELSPTPYPRPRGAGESGGIIRLDNLITDFADTAALLKQMDCLITVDTSTAHLAAALGVKTFLLLPYCPDWRWGVVGETTVWYPSMTLLRQPKYGDWESVIETLTALLKRRL
ncbi:MAG: tetratricopeptide repeat protein [Alphaproteobacteria bacterium]